MDARSIAATAANGGILTAATAYADDYAVPEYDYDDSSYKARIYQGFSKAEPEADLIYGPNIKDWPEQIGLCDNILLKVCAKIMRIINSDGSEAEMCGNGIRCFAKYVHDHNIITKDEFTVETLAGIMKPKVTVGADGKVSLVTINMGKPMTERSQIPMEGPAGPVINEPLDVDGTTYNITSMRMHPLSPIRA